MMKRSMVIFLAALIGVITTAGTQLAQRPAPKPQIPSTSGVTMTADTETALVKQFCAGCHNERTKSGSLDLTAVNFRQLDQRAELVEKMIRKLRAGMMPPSGALRPDSNLINNFAASLEAQMDRLAATRPATSHQPFQRLNRAEYANSIHDLLDLDVDVASMLPPDSLGRGFDNIAEALTLSPALMEGYVRAASKISRLAVGDSHAAPVVATFTMPRTASQMRHVEGTPFGTRGGISVIYNFPADGEYIFRMEPFDDSNGLLVGSKNATEGEQIEVSIDGDRIALLDVDPKMTVTTGGVFVQTAPIRVQAGPRRVAAAYIERYSGPIDDLIAPIEQTLTDSEQGSGDGITMFSHLKNLAIRGPFNITGISDTPSRRRIFTCRPTSPSDETRCATDIVRNLGSKAFRRPVTPEDMEGLMAFYSAGRQKGDFESGIRQVLEAVVASPNFVFRIESEPGSTKPGQTFRISDTELATRLSFFLWSTSPDDELLKLASQKKLSDPATLEAQVRRMLADPRSETLATRFAAQWLHLKDLDTMNPDPLYYPQYDQTLAHSMRRETELFFDSIIRENRNVLDLLTADYTFVDERLAKHYQIPNIEGSRFRRVNVNRDYRRGLLGEGSILTLTSIADRTSPVARGKFVMEVLLGTPPPPPPPNVPDLQETKAIQGERVLTVRQRMEAHRANPTCAGCHRLMDPIGLAMENFDAIGRWRELDAGSAIDPSGQLWDGTKLEGPGSLRQALLDRSGVFISNFTEKLMMYALGRRIEFDDMPAVRAIVRDAGLNNNRFSAFVLGIVKRPQFQLRAVQQSTTNNH